MAHIYCTIKDIELKNYQLVKDLKATISKYIVFLQHTYYMPLNY